MNYKNQKFHGDKMRKLNRNRILNNQSPKMNQLYVRKKTKNQ